MKSSQLQIRLSPAQKESLRRRARRAGQDISAFVLSRVCPPGGDRFRELARALGGQEDRRYALAAIHDLLEETGSGAFPEVVAEPPPPGLPPLEANLLAAMVEQTATRKGATPPAWTSAIPPLAEPWFASDLKGLRAHLVRAAPVPFRRRNLFVDSTLGDRT